MKTPEEIGTQVLATLKAQAIRNRQAADLLRDQIRMVLAQHAEPARLSACEVRKQLNVHPLPSLRTVQGHLKAMRNIVGVACRVDAA